MDQTEKAYLLNILVGGTFGAVAGALMGLVVNVWSAWWRRWRLYRRLDLKPEKRSGHRVRARVRNGYVVPMNSVCAYITIDHDPSDVLPPPFGCQAYIKPGDHRFEEDRLCWSVAGNPAYVDIYAKEKQLLDIVEIGPSRQWIQIPSESGWGSDGGTSRVFLKMKKYIAIIKIVSRDTKAKEFGLQIDPFNETEPIALVQRKTPTLLVEKRASFVVS